MSLQKIKKAILKDDESWGGFVFCVVLAIAGSFIISLYFNVPKNDTPKINQTTEIIQPKNVSEIEFKNLEKRIKELEDKINYGI